MAKFFPHLEASAEAYWQVPDVRTCAAILPTRTTTTIPTTGRRLDDDDAEDVDSATTTWTTRSWDDDEGDELYGAAYEDMVYRDSTDDGFDADIIDECADGTEFELEEEAQRLGQRLEFLDHGRPAVAARRDRLEACDAEHDAERRELLDNWCEQADRRATTSCSSWSKPCTAIRFRSRAARTNRWSNSTASG